MIGRDKKFIIKLKEQKQFEISKIKIKNFKIKLNNI
tara:strand:- start:441 stop:548 length:108 start_codon:yes stop_codon:yes gene_type:complete